MYINGPYSSVLWCLLVGIFCVNAAHYMSIPFLSLYLVNKIHCPLWIGGIAVGVAPLFSIVGGLLGGQLSDRYGRLILLYSSLLATSAIFILFYGVFNLESNALQWGLIIFLNAFFGVFTSLFQPSMMALMSDLVDERYKDQVFHFRYAAMNMGAVTGALLGVLLGVALSSVAFLIGGVIYLVYGGILYRVLGAQKTTKIRLHTPTTILDSIRVVFIDKRLFYFVLFHLIFAVCYAQITSTLAVFIAQQVPNSSQVYSFVIAFNAVFVLMGQAPIYFLCKKKAKSKVIFYGCILFCIGCFGFAYSGKSASYFYASTLVITLGELLVFPFASSFIDEIAPSHLKGTYFGALTFRELGLGFGPVLGGALLQFLGGRDLFLLIGVLALSSYYFMVHCERANYLVMNSEMNLDEGG